jgi:phosphoglycerate dehydrogenase-like enzyme
MPGTRFLSRPLPPEALDLARARATVRLNEMDRRLDPTELAARLGDVHPGLLECPNAVLAPHIASASRETQTKKARAVEDCLAVLEGRRRANAVTPEVPA